MQVRFVVRAQNHRITQISQYKGRKNMILHHSQQAFLFCGVLRYYKAEGMGHARWKGGECKTCEVRALAPLPRLRPNFEIRVYSRFDSVGVNPEELGILIPGEGASEAPFQILPLYNYTMPTGSGYHFDALSRKQCTQEGVNTYQVNKRHRASEATDTTDNPKSNSDSKRNTATMATHTQGCYGVSTNVGSTAKAHLINKGRPVDKLHALPYPEGRPSSGTNTTKAIATAANNERGREPEDKEEMQRGGPDLNQLRAILQNFFSTRSSSPILVSELDAKEVAAAWFAEDALALKLHTLLQSELNYADNGMHTARRLLDQFRGYYNACTTGGPKRLGTLTRPKTNGHVGTAEAENDGTKQSAITTAEHTGVKAWIPKRRLRRKTADPEAPRMEACSNTETPIPSGPTTANCEADENAPFILRVSGPKQDPRAQLENLLQSKVTLIREHPTLPCEFKQTSFEPIGFDLPPTHCAFKGCHFAATTENDVLMHVTEKHAAALQSIVNSPIFPLVGRPALAHAYSLLLTAKCQENPPVANCSIDRRCLRAFRNALTTPDLQELVCFVCARRYPYVPNASNQKISWRSLHEDGDILRCKHFETLLALSVEGYRSTYMVQSPLEVQATMREELEEWACQFQCGEMNIDILCCPEDKRCLRKCGPREACRQCEAPICASCWGCLGQQKCPPEALANDMMIFYAPKEIYEQQVTFMELVCASPCITTMVCFSLEKKYRQHRMFDQQAFMHEFRVAARGNATTFPLPWENLLDILEGALNTAGPATPLPHIGQDLKNFVSVILKSNDPIENPDSLSKFIHQAVVRRQVVIDLILGALERGHRGYQHLDSESVKLRAQSLPINGVPAEVVAVMSNDEQLSHIKRSKAAAPVAEEQSLADVLAEFTCSMKPNAVVNEKSVTGHGDHEAMTKAALHHISETVEPQSATVQTLKIKTGQQVMDQFEPWYFGVAFAFVFKYCLGMPDLPAWSKKPRWRRPQTAPHIGLASWTRAMARRIEAQINRDWTFGFASWNLLFRSAVNLARTIDSYEAPVYDEDSNTYRKLSPQDLEHGALQLVAALQGSYRDMSGKLKPVKGDISKLSYVPSLKPAARKILKNARHVARGVPGTQEARRQMRYEIEAMRMRYGVPLFVTFSPDEAHQILFVRMVRTRQGDPVNCTQLSGDNHVGSSDWPTFTEGETIPINVHQFRAGLPTWEQRRQILARDPLAVVDGFQTLVQLVLRHLFGLRICPCCPRCNCWNQGTGCQDAAGSNATYVGGVFGRMDAVYISYEAQKSTGSLHAHAQCFVQCLHQHLQLEELFHRVEQNYTRIVNAYLAYNAHVARAQYGAGQEQELQKRIAEAEATWPEHRNEMDMVAAPAYQRKRFDEKTAMEDEARAWAKEYLDEDVTRLQILKQHHVHIRDPETHERIPLRGCQRADKPKECKSEFPRTPWLSESAKVLCPCQLLQHNMPARGRKNRLGSLHGPYTHEWLNPCHPAMLAALRGCNVDVQVPYRLPFHCSTCGTAATSGALQDIILAVQRAQDAQTGYCADYCAKSQPMAFHEIKEFQKGHVFLHSNLTQEQKGAWYIQRRRCPVCPHFANSPVPRRLEEDASRTALLGTAYFRAWTLQRNLGDHMVPHISELKADTETWTASFRKWLSQLPCQETKRYVGNFLSVYRIRPTHDTAENSDNSDCDDPLNIDKTTIDEALQTLVPHAHGQAKEATIDIDAAISQAKVSWGTTSHFGTASPNAYAETDAKLHLRAARQKKEHQGAAAVPLHSEPSVSVNSNQNIAQRIRLWLEDVAARPRTAKNHCNREQIQFLRHVAERVLRENSTGQDAGATADAGDEPMRWAVHGGPGTGKSHALRILRTELFENILGWRHGIEFKILTLQAVMAEQVDGDTIHHGVGLHGRHADAEISLARLLALRAEATRWRWLLLDEISMDSAELLARLELRCRELVRDASVSKYAKASSQARPFGGLNVIFMGDWWQLEPPKGTFLANLPLQWLSSGTTKKRPHAAHGQALLWEKGSEGVQGVTELYQCERTHDEWLQAVQEEFRHCALTDTTHAFLHGRPTSVPGSYCNGRLCCADPKCIQMLQAQTTPEEILHQECETCRNERLSRALVIHSPNDIRLQGHFAQAVCIFSTNALKYHVNKLRAQQFAALRSRALYYAVASDRISSRALQAKPDLQQDKLSWLKRHDKECGNLYGILPLCLGLPVVATDHLDRGRKILRGCRGHVVGWTAEQTLTKGHVTEDNATIWNTLPSIVYVSFQTEQIWQIGSLPPNVFPIAPMRSTWFLDSGRAKPQLAISRRQFPLVPAFASTAHAAQGQTLPQGVIADLQIGANGNPFTSYVAMTRVKDRQHLLIYRPFDAKPFQRGIGLGRDLLLRVWRQEAVDWEAIRKVHIEEKPCSECFERKGKKAYTVGQWKRGDRDRVCKECVWHHARTGCPWQCSVCRTWAPEDAFAGTAQTNSFRSFSRVCATCRQRKPCHRCRRLLPEEDFNKSAWKTRNADRRICKGCLRKARDHWACARCKIGKDKTLFRRYTRKHPSRPNGTQVCDACWFQGAMLWHAANTNKRLARVRKRLKEKRVAQIVAEVYAHIAECRRTAPARAERCGVIDRRQADIENAKGATATMLPRPGIENVAPAAEPSKPIIPPLAPPSEAACGQQSATLEKLFVYTCPFCHGTVNSQVFGGKIDHRSACGHQFRVRNGEAVRQYEDVCPRCGTAIVSSKSSGRVQSQHRTPTGKACPQSAWIVRN